MTIVAHFDGLAMIGGAAAIKKNKPVKKAAAVNNNEKKKTTTQKKKAPPQKTKRTTPKRGGGDGDWADDVDDWQCYAYPFDVTKAGSIQGLKLDEAEMQALCDVRGELKKTVGLPSNDDVNMTGEQAAKLRSLLNAHQDIQLKPILSNKYLRACKYVLGRWLRPKEATQVFGADLGGTIYRATFKLKNIDTGNDTAEPFVGKDADGNYNARVSHLIGHSGRIINAITRHSGALYVWFGDAKVRVYVFVRKGPNASGRAHTKITKVKSALEERSAQFQGRKGEQGLTLATLESARKAPFSTMIRDAS